MKMLAVSLGDWFISWIEGDQPRNASSRVCLANLCHTVSLHSNWFLRSNLQMHLMEFRITERDLQCNGIIEWLRKKQHWNWTKFFNHQWHQWSGLSGLLVSVQKTVSNRVVGKDRGRWSFQHNCFLKLMASKLLRLGKNLSFHIKLSLRSYKVN